MENIRLREAARRLLIVANYMHISMWNFDDILPVAEELLLNTNWEGKEDIVISAARERRNIENADKRSLV